MMSRTQIILYLLVIILICTCFVVFSDTLALFETDSEGEISNDIGKWVIKVNNETITEAEVEEIDITNFNYSTSSLVENGYIAPGGTAFFDLVVDATECDVAVLYTVDLNLDETDYDDNISFNLMEIGGNTVVRTDEYAYSGIIPLSSIQNGDTKTLRVNITWLDVATYNDSDTELGKVEDSKLLIPIKFHAQQYLGETLVPYSG